MKTLITITLFVATAAAQGFGGMNMLSGGGMGQGFPGMSGLSGGFEENAMTGPVSRFLNGLPAELRNLPPVQMLLRMLPAISRMFGGMGGGSGNNPMNQLSLMASGMGGGRNPLSALTSMAGGAGGNNPLSMLTGMAGGAGGAGGNNPLSGLTGMLGMGGSNPMSSMMGRSGDGSQAGTSADIESPSSSTTTSTPSE